MFWRKNKAFRQKRKALQAQVRWCTEMALDAYLKDDPIRCNDWTAEAAKVQVKILRLYPRYQKPVRTVKTVFVPVYASSRKSIEVTE